MCLRARGMPDAAATFSIEVARQVYKQVRDYIYLDGDANHDADLSADVYRHIRDAWWRSRKNTLELYADGELPLN